MANTIKERLLKEGVVIVDRYQLEHKGGEVKIHENGVLQAICRIEEIDEVMAIKLYF